MYEMKTIVATDEDEATELNNSSNNIRREELV